MVFARSVSHEFHGGGTKQIPVSLGCGARRFPRPSVEKGTYDCQLRQQVQVKYVKHNRRKQKHIISCTEFTQGIENSSILAWKKLTHPWARSPTLRNCQPANVEASIYSASDSSHLNILHAHILRQLTNFNRSCQQVTVTVQIALYRSR